MRVFISIARTTDIKLILTFSIFIAILGPEVALSQCTMRATSIGFGNYDVFLNSPLDTSGTFILDCQAFVTKVNVTLAASSTSGTFNPRKMKRTGGSDLLSYNIYTDVSRTIIFGNGTGGTSEIILRKPHGKPDPWSQTVTVYGRIPPGEDVSAGTYSDVLTLTVTF